MVGSYYFNYSPYEYSYLVSSYRTIADRILKMRLVPSRRFVKRDVSYEFMNRQMVWHAFTVSSFFVSKMLTLIICRNFYSSSCHLSVLGASVDV